MGLDIGINLLEKILFTTTFAGSFWIMQLTLITATLAMITRKVSDWKILALPVSVGWHAVGLPVSMAIMIASALFFIIDPVTLNVVTNTIQTARERIPILRRERIARRLSGLAMKEKIDDLRIKEATYKTRYKDKLIGAMKGKRKSEKEYLKEMKIKEMKKHGDIGYNIALANQQGKLGKISNKIMTPGMKHGYETQLQNDLNIKAMTKTQGALLKIGAKPKRTVSKPAAILAYEEKRRKENRIAPRGLIQSAMKKTFREIKNKPKKITSKMDKSYLTEKVLNYKKGSTGRALDMATSKYFKSKRWKKKKKSSLTKR